jgi:hypothetical protein
MGGVVDEQRPRGLGESAGDDQVPEAEEVDAGQRQAGLGVLLGPLRLGVISGSSTGGRLGSMSWGDPSVGGLGPGIGRGGT